LSKLVDTSVAVKWIAGEPGSDAAARLYTEQLFAPELMLAELAHVLSKKVRGGELTAEQAIAGYAETEQRLEFISLRGAEMRALEIALELHVGAYDSFFLLLAEITGTPLITADERLVRACADTRFAALVERLV
jgi:predicted nucleic acid-binding protein